MAFQNKARLELALKKYRQGIESFKYATVIGEHLLGHNSALFRKLQAQKALFIMEVRREEASSVKLHEDLRDDRKAYRYFKPLELSVQRLKQLSTLIPDEIRNAMSKEPVEDICDLSPAEAPQKAELSNMIGDVLSLLY